MTFIQDPLVSCICVTHNNIEFLKKSIACFQHQTYQHKELIVAFSSDNMAASALVDQFQDASVKSLVFSSATPLTLGEKRNLAVRNSGGFYFCVWDDDDWHSVDRISTHVKSLVGTKYQSSILSNVFLYDGNTDEAYLSATRYGWEQTLFCQKSLFEDPAFQYENLERGEDSPLIYKLKKSNRLLTIRQPELYIYVYHGGNTFHRDHWEVNLLQWSTKLSAEQSRLVKRILRSEITMTEASQQLNHILKP